MSSKPILCGVILAAGKSSRMGIDKALLPWPPAPPGTAPLSSGTLLSAAISALSPFTTAMVVVAGTNADDLTSHVHAGRATLVRNPAPERGQFSSLLVGLREVLARGCNSAMITPIDCPPMSAATLDQLCAAFELAVSRGKWGVAPESGGKHGHPLLASHELIDAFLNASFTSNAREIRRAHAEHMEYIHVLEPFVTAELNTPEEYTALSKPASSKPH